MGNRSLLTDSDYFINTDVIAYMEANNLPKYLIKPIIKKLKTIFANDSQWNDFLANNGIAKDRYIKIATKGALIDSIITHSISKELAIISDDAGQFGVLLYALKRIKYSCYMRG